MLETKPTRIYRHEVHSRYINATKRLRNTKIHGAYLVLGSFPTTLSPVTKLGDTSSQSGRATCCSVLGDFFSLVWPLILLPTTTWPRTRCSTVQCTRQTAPPLSVQSHRKHVGNGRPPMQFNCPPRASKRKGCWRTVCHCSSTHNRSEKCKGRDFRYRHSAIYGNEGRGLVWSSRHVTFCRSLGRPTW